MDSRRATDIPGSYFDGSHNTPMTMESGDIEVNTVSPFTEHLIGEIAVLLREERQWHARQNEILRRRIFHVIGELSNISRLLGSLKRASLNGIETIKHLISKTLTSSLPDVVRARIHDRPEPYRPKVALLSSSQAVSDTLIESEWSKLDYNITNIAIELSKFTFKPRKQAEHELYRLAPELTTAVDVLHCGENTRYAAICCHIWRRLTSAIFHGGGDVWGSDVTQAWKNYRCKLIESCFEKNDMQQLAAGMAQVPGKELFKPSPEKIAQTARAESEIFRVLVQAASSLNIDDLSERFQEIIEMAVNIEGIFLASRAVFEVDWLHGRQTTLFNGVEMTTVPYQTEDSASKTVLFLCRPLLKKTGNMEGQFYDVSNVLMKAGAVCEEPVSCDNDSNASFKTAVAI